ncbi:MAG: hypothetical protein HUU50_09480 [Candidatus Brocadiae bacterium]|nr:hypothetical protein [Candidatus Brocadiia bacterium]
MKLLSDLFVLQEIDKEIAQLRASQQRLPQKLNKKKKELQEARTHLSNFEEEIKKKKVSIKEKESLLLTYDGNILKKQAQLNSIKTNREYSSLLEEIKAAKQEKSHLEDAILESMEDLERQKEKYEGEKKGLDGIEAEYKEFKEDVDKDLKEIEQEMSKVQQKRQAQREIVESQDRQTLLMYERVLSVNGKDGMAAVDEGSCGYCRSQLIPNEVVGLRSGNLIFCKDCGRLMYFMDMISQ